MSGLKGSDWNYLDDLAKLRAERAEKEKETKVSIVCNHILFEATPLLPMKTVDLKVEPQHPKHDGHVYCCEACAFLFDKFNLSQATENFSVLPAEQFIRNMK